jgi:HK97 family phage major capsid protein
MDKYEALRREREGLVEKMEECTSRHGFDRSQRRAFDKMKARVDEIDRELREDEVVIPYQGPFSPSTTPVGQRSDPGIGTASGPEHRDMFPSARDEYTDFADFGEFCRTMKSGRHDDRLEARALTGAVGSDGGYSVPIQWERWLMDEALGQEVIRPLVKTYPMGSRTLRVPAWDTADLSAGGTGGAIGYWVQEGGTIAETSPKVRQVELSAKKFAVLERSSLEVAEDAIDFGSQVAAQMASTIGHYLDKAFIRGSGAGEPQGLLNAPCKVSITAETGQSASTIVLENIAKAYSRMIPAAQRRAVWLANPDCVPELYNLSIAVGTGGSWVSPMREESGNFYLMGRPVYFSSHCSTLGTEGDLVYFDPQSYAVGLVGGSLRFDFSDHTFFTSAQRAFRGLIRVDGQCLVEDAITPAQGSNTWSPVVTIATRS